MQKIAMAVLGCLLLGVNVARAEEPTGSAEQAVSPVQGELSTNYQKAATAAQKGKQWAEAHPEQVKAAKTTAKTAIKKRAKNKTTQ